jgi:hypothetical protein
MFPRYRHPPTKLVVQGGSENLRVLEEVGLVHALLRGRERVHQLDASQLRTLTTGWIDRFGSTADGFGSTEG